MEKGSIKFSIQSWLLSLNSEPQKSRSASISDSAPPCMQNCRWGAKVIAATRLWVVRFANRGSRKGRQEQGTFLRRVKRLSQGWRTLLRAQTSSLAAPCRTPVWSRRASRARVPRPIAGQLACVECGSLLPSGDSGTHPPPPGCQLRPCAPATTGLTRSLGSLSCPRVAIQGKTRGSLQ